METRTPRNVPASTHRPTAWRARLGACGSASTKRTLELGSAGSFRDELNDLVLAGTKTATAGLWRVDYVPHGEQMEEVGEQLVLLGSKDEQVARVEVTRIEPHPFASIPAELARDSGEGFRSIAGFQAGYREFYRKQGVTIEDDDLLICIWFAQSQREITRG